MIESKQNVFNNNGLTVITTNSISNSAGELIMGAGVAKSAKLLYPELPRLFADAIKERPYYFVAVETCEREFGALQTKFHWKDPSPIELVKKSCRAMLRYVNEHNISKVYMTRPGCGNGGLSWSDVKPLISFLDDRFIVCHANY